MIVVSISSVVGISISIRVTTISSIVVISILCPSRPAPWRWSQARPPAPGSKAHAYVVNFTQDRPWCYG